MATKMENKKALEETNKWYENFYNKEDINYLTIKQIKDFLNYENNIWKKCLRKRRNICSCKAIKKTTQMSDSVREFEKNC